jgi:ABC-2 type transport system permease protein
MSIVIVFTILSEMNIPFYDNSIKPWLFTTHMVAWKGFFYVKATDDGVTIPGTIENLSSILKSLAILFGYIAGFVFVAVWIFRKKDILS